MLKLLNAVRIVCFVLALCVMFSGLIFSYLQKPVPLTLLQRFGIILPLLAIFNVATTHIRKSRLATAEPKDSLEVIS